MPVSASVACSNLSIHSVDRRGYPPPHPSLYLRGHPFLLPCRANAFAVRVPCGDERDTEQEQRRCEGVLGERRGGVSYRRWSVLYRWISPFFSCGVKTKQLTLTRVLMVMYFLCFDGSLSCRGLFLLNKALERGGGGGWGGGGNIYIYT